MALSSRSEKYSPILRFVLQYIWQGNQTDSGEIALYKTMWQKFVNNMKLWVVYKCALLIARSTAVKRKNATWPDDQFFVSLWVTLLKSFWSNWYVDTGWHYRFSFEKWYKPQQRQWNTVFFALSYICIEFVDWISTDKNTQISDQQKHTQNRHICRACLLPSFRWYFLYVIAHFEYSE